MRSRLSPLGAVACGVAAGLVGSLAQSVFFRVTKRLTPKSSPDAFAKPEPEQSSETATQTVARRVVEDMAQRGPIEDKETAAEVVHYTFGGAWGGVYGMLAGSLPVVCSLRGGVAFGLGVWLVSDNLVLPSFRLAAWPGAYSVNTHLYAIAAHAVYGGAVYVTFASLEKFGSRRWLAALATYFLERKLWKPLRAPVRRVARPTIRYSLMARDVARALQP